MKFRHIGLVVVLTGCGERPPISIGGLTDGLTTNDASTSDRDRGPVIIGDCTHPPVQRKCSDGWCTVPAGCFVMGSPPGERCRPTYYKETQHRVMLTHSFLIAQTEVTQSQFEAEMGYNPSSYKACGGNCPVENVSWFEAVVYCNRLSMKKGLKPCYVNTGSKKQCSSNCPYVSTPTMGYPESCVLQTCSLFEEASEYRGQNIYDCPGYRLPTEAEWEYAFRAGTKTAYYNGPVTHCGTNSNADAIAWYGGAKTGKSTTYPVGGKLPNNWGLYDMAGNVSEWIHDWFSKDLGSDDMVNPAGPPGDPRTQHPYPHEHPLRGGSWYVGAAYVRAACRGNKSIPSGSYHMNGFRCVRSL